METKSEPCNSALTQPLRSSEGSDYSKLMEILTKSLALWHSIYPGANNRDLAVILVAYATVVVQLSPEQLASACQGVLKRSHFFPTPAEILELAGEPAVQGMELEAERSWQTVLRDFDGWGTYRTSAGLPLKATKTVYGKPADQNCAERSGLGWCSITDSAGVSRMKHCGCTEPHYEHAPELPAATLYALDTLGGYRAVEKEVYGAKASYLHKRFIEAYLFHRKASGWNICRRRKPTSSCWRGSKGRREIVC